MLNSDIKFWDDCADLAIAPYAEKANLKPNWFDRTLTGWWGGYLPRLPGKKYRLKKFVAKVDACAAEFDNVPDFAIRQKAAQLRPLLLKNGYQHELVARSFALIREVTRRKLGLWHHPVQLQGGLAMLEGTLVEMATGEGKTITALLPAITAALAGLPVHVITVNDYLAQRDEETLRPVFNALGISSGIIQHDLSVLERRQVYAADIVYVTNKEIVFDYLKDRIALNGSRSAARIAAKSFFSGTGGACGMSSLVLRGLHYAIIDEADSILIDEARTPLIISADSDSKGDAEMYELALQLVATFVEDKDFQINHKDRYIQLTPAGKDNLEQLTESQEGLWRIRRAREELAQQALSALHLFERDVHYIVLEDKVQIVDEFTGRIMEDRSWEGGLHQMIEMKEDCELTARRETQARITYQRFFSRYRRLAGMSGTALEVSGELYSVFNLRSTPIPTNKPIIRKDYGIKLYATIEDKWNAVVARIKQLAGVEFRPVLIGVISVEASEYLSLLLDKENVDHVVLNARQDSEEAAIVARAGEKCRVTVATNMAGRGTDISLASGVKELGGLHVILTEFHESSRIDRQLYGRSGRQGDPGSCESIISLEDEIFLRYSNVYANHLKKIKIKNGILPSSLGHLLRTKVQNAAERENLRTRRMQVKHDGKLDKSLSFTGISE